MGDNLGVGVRWQGDNLGEDILLWFAIALKVFFFALNPRSIIGVKKTGCKVYRVGGGKCPMLPKFCEGPFNIFWSNCVIIIFRGTFYVLGHMDIGKFDFLRKFKE